MPDLPVLLDRPGLEVDHSGRADMLHAASRRRRKDGLPAPAAHRPRDARVDTRPVRPRNEDGRLNVEGGDGLPWPHVTERVSGS